LLNSTSRFYRVKSFPQSLQIQPTNVVIGMGMTNRYKVFLVFSGSTSVDVTANAVLTSLNTSIAQFAGFNTNSFALVRGVSTGTASIRAVYQGMTNTVNLTVSQLTGLYTVPTNAISGYVEGSST